MNLTIVRSAATLGTIFSLALPFSTQAINGSRWEGRYEGTWTNTYSNDCFDAGATGDLVVRLLKVKNDGTISSATVKFSDGSLLDATGSIYKKNGIRRIRLNYSFDETTDYRIKGKLTGDRKIKGSYVHADSSCEPGWGGTVKAHHV